MMIERDDDVQKRKKNGVVPLTPADQGKEPGRGKTVVPVPGNSRKKNYCMAGC